MPHEKKRTANLMESLCKGITIGKWADNRAKAFFVRFGANRSVESFANECDRNDRASKLAQIQEEQGSKSFEFDPVQWRAYVAFLSRSGATLTELERMWNERLQRPKEAPLCIDAVEAYKKLRLSEHSKNWESGDSYRHIKKHLGRITHSFGHLRLDSITTDILRNWFADLRNPETKLPFDKATLVNHRKDVNVFFKRCVDEEWITKNPCSMVKLPKLKPKNKPPMPVRDIFQLMKANRDEMIVGHLALEIFGSLRCSSAARCKEDWIKWDRKGILLPGADDEGEESLHKSGKTLFRQGHPEALWLWLKHAQPIMWDVTESMHPHRKGDAFVRASVKNPGNGLRRSCASYQLALTKNVGPVSYLMQHKHASTTQIYEGVADEKDALLFMAITPESVLLTWEQFVQLHQPKQKENP